VEGFLLPLSAMLSFVLLLVSLSLQSVSLQGRLQGAAEQRLQESEARLASAAQLLVAQIQLRHACLLLHPRERWGAAGCASPTDLERLERGEVLGSRWQLVRWQPGPAVMVASRWRQSLALEIELRSEGPDPGPRSAFLLQLEGGLSSWRVQELRSLGLRGRLS
jgi:hypothetical protein